MATVYRLVGLDISVYQFESTENGVSSKFNALGWLAGELAENATLRELADLNRGAPFVDFSSTLLASPSTPQCLLRRRWFAY